MSNSGKELAAQTAGSAVPSQNWATKKRLQLFVINNLSWFLIIVFYAIFAALRPAGMLKLSTVTFMVYAAVPLGALVIGESLCLLIGGLDVSLAQLAGFVAMLSALIITEWLPGLPPLLTIFIPILVGLIGGAINGFFIGFVGLNPFLVTLGTYMAFEGGTLLLRSYPIYTGFPDIYVAIGGDDLLAISLFVAIILIMAFILRFTRFGLHLYGVGGNADAVRMLGVNPAKMRFFTFALAGGFAGLSALFYTGFLNSVPPSMADGDIFLAFGGAVIGGISLEGGQGSMLNTFAGLLFLALIEAGLSMFNVDPYLRRVIYGLLVVVAILINKSRAYLRDSLLQTE